VLVNEPITPPLMIGTALVIAGIATVILDRR
jgi:drug/metabolite transporter (DMT)-like permease